MSGASMEPVLLSLVRSPRGLAARYSRQQTAVARRRSEPGVDARAAFVAEVGALPRTAGPLLGAWERLRVAVPAGASVLADILEVLLSTVTAAVYEPIPAFRIEEPARTLRPTAAHPRAFKGTKYKPAKRAEPAARDLRPHLCTPASIHALLSALWPERDEARGQLRRRRFEAPPLTRIFGASVPPPDPYLAYHHNDAPARPALPPEFVEQLLPALRGAPWSLVRQAIALHTRLALIGDPGLTALIARLLHFSGAGLGIAWVTAAETLPPTRRFPFIALVLETNAWRTDPTSLPPSIVTDLAHAPEARHESLAFDVLEAIGRRANRLYIAAGLRCATTYELNASIRVPHDAPDFTDETAALLERVVPDDWDGYERLGLWRMCGAVPGSVGYLMRVPWARYSSARRSALLALVTGLKWRDDIPLPARTWRAIADFLPVFERHLLEIPETHVSQYGNDPGEILETLATPEEIRDRWPLALDLLARLNRPPFHAEGNVAGPIANLLKLPAPQRRRVLDASDEAFLRLDKSCRRENDARLVAWGLSSLVARMPDLVADAFGTAPALLLRTARELGVLSWGARADLVGRLLSAPLFTADLAEQPLEALVATIDAARLPEGKGAVPRAVREHLSGRRALAPAQIQKRRDTLVHALPAARLAAIGAAVEARLAASIGARQATRDTLSALAVLQHARKNRRSLRRVLRAHAEGDTGYLRRHASTREWERGHPRIDVDVWTRGVDGEYTGADGRVVSVRTEQDTVEVLRMGTYVGSCLGLGGRFTDSAGAVLLDINKQVLYARDDRGTVLARQLVGLSKDDRLVPFAVYPRSAPRWLRQVFDEHDRRLAKSLGVDVVQRGDDYTIEFVLSQEWWDDGLWELSDDDDAEEDALP